LRGETAGRADDDEGEARGVSFGRFVTPSLPHFEHLTISISRDHESQ
jgi:hypothetical protein